MQEELLEGEVLPEPLPQISRKSIQPVFVTAWGLQIRPHGPPHSTDSVASANSVKYCPEERVRKSTSEAPLFTV